MRDIRLARHQFFGALLLLLIALGEWFFFFLPQSRQYEASRLALGNSEANVLTIFKEVPIIAPGKSQSWQKDLLGSLAAELGRDVVVTLVEGDLSQASPLEKPLPPAIKKVPITVTLHGSYAVLQQAIGTLAAKSPVIEIREIRIKSVDAAKLAPEESPVLEGVIHLHLYVKFAS